MFTQWALPAYDGVKRVEGGIALKRLRQIVTKAVVAKGKKRTEERVTLSPTNKPTSILGCWVINHTCSAKRVGKFVEVTGKFDVNVWYAYSNHSKTAVFSETVHYKDKVKLHYREGEISVGEDVQYGCYKNQIVLKRSSLHVVQSLKL